MADVPAPTPQNTDGIWIILIVSFIFFAWVSNGGPSKFEAEHSATSTVQVQRTSQRTPPSSITKGKTLSTQTNTDSHTSSYAKKVIIVNRGNAARERWADNEYITLQNVSKEPITITGWYLQNGRDQRGFINNLNLLAPGVPDTASIPKGVRTLWANTAHRMEPIVLASRDKTIITSGSMTKKASFLGSSFSVNKCSGYLNEYPGYALQPKISNQCPRPSTEAGLDLLEDSCYNFVKKLSACHTPVYREEMQKSGELRQYLDRTYGLSRVCREYVQSHYSYQWCVFAHAQDTDFYKNEWRIYLNRRVQMWDSGREHISLYDAQGRLVDELSY